jgi:hypothetical protein
MANLENTISEINRQAIQGNVWIDGSFLTEKLNPDDADIALMVTRPVFQGLSRSQRQFFDDFSHTSRYPKYKIDNYGVVLDLNDAEGHWWSAYWLRQFGFSRGGELKGIVLVSVPFLVVP